ncbi:MAG: FAD:protein FMN transferase [Gaiellaceae bacterium]
MSARASFAALGTTATVVVRDGRALPHARRLLVEELDRIDRAASRFRDDSELAYANAAAGETVRVSELFAELVEVALSAAASTDGLVIPTLGAPLRAAGYDRTFSLVQARDGWALLAVTPEPDAWRVVRLDVERRELRVPHGVELDLGATAKALAADRAAARVAAATGSGVLVSLGGDVAVAGEAPAGGWPVRIADDHDAPLDGPGPVVGIAAGGLATSSTVVRSWPTDGGVGHHVLDPRTARPAVTPWRTVSVAGASCVDANTAATGALVAGADAPAWLAGRGVHARLVAQSGEVVLVGGWPAGEAVAA